MNNSLSLFLPFIHELFTSLINRHLGLFVWLRNTLFFIKENLRSSLVIIELERVRKSSQWDQQ